MGTLICFVLVVAQLCAVWAFVPAAFVQQTRQRLTTISPTAASILASTEPSSDTASLSFDRPPSRNEAEANLNAASLTPLQRFGRALSFYRAAVPLFVSYKSLKFILDFKRDTLGDKISEEEENKLYENIHEWGSEQIVQKINELKGFYVKTGQIISTRVDIFPKQYTSKLAITQDKLDPLPASVVKDVVRRELLNGAELGELFLEFDEVPLGSASIAQVHRARLLDGRVVAVKVQRPGIGAKLLGDIANLKNFAKLIGNALFLDYYKIFSELERTLVYELDFLHEAMSANKVAAAVAHSPANKLQRPPVKVPLPIPGLVTKHVLVMEYIDGKALSQLAAEMSQRGVAAGSAESKLLGGKLLSALTDAYGRMIFGSGIIHGDPHPGNIFVLSGGDVALLDCGQVKEINTAQRLGLAKVIVLVQAWEQVNKQLGNVKAKFASDASASQNARATANQLSIETRRQLQGELDRLTAELANLVRSFGVTFKPNAGDECAAAVAVLLFGHTDTVLPGGYAGEEISLDSPIVQVLEFPAEMVLLGRATVMIKGIANRLQLSWGLSDRWMPLAKEAVDSVQQGPQQLLPVWTVSRPVIVSPSNSVSTLGSSVSSGSSTGPAGQMTTGDNTNGVVSTTYNSAGYTDGSGQLRFEEVKASFFAWVGLLKEYLLKKAVVFAQRSLPRPVQQALFNYLAKRAGYT